MTATSLATDYAVWHAHWVCYYPSFTDYFFLTLSANAAVRAGIVFA